MIYEIAGLRIQIENKYEYTTKFCRGYLSNDQLSPATLTATVTEEEFLEEKKNSAQFSDGYIENICLYRSICLQLPKYNRFLLHTSVLEYDGEGYAFLGRSGTGKSTHTKLWLKHLPNTRVVNGDKPILECTDKGFIVYGTPWQGKENWGYKGKVFLRGLCFLEQAPVNQIRKLSTAETSNRIFTQVLLPEKEEDVVATLELLDKLIMNTPAYLLSCTISEDAVKTSFEEMTGKAYENCKKVEG